MKQHRNRNGKTRWAACALASALSSLVIACSTSVDGKDPIIPPQPAENTNLRFGFDPGFALGAPITDFQVAGGVIPGNGTTPDRAVAFFAYVTEDNTLGPSPADPSAPPDGNSVADVYVAAIDSSGIDTRAFIYGLSSVFRHPRCMTCHSMNVDPANPPAAGPSTAFATDPEGHPGGNPPLNDLTDTNCKDCHFEDWRAPAQNLDFRGASVAELAARANTGFATHLGAFLNPNPDDERVAWALGNGVSPFGNAADDDHDGIVEVQDTDNVVRTVPGGLDKFVERLAAWAETDVGGNKLTDSAALAVDDVVLVTRDASGTMAGGGASFSPSVVYVPDAPIADGGTTKVGTLYVAYASDAIDMVGGQTNGVTDVFRATVEVHVDDATGDIDLTYTGQELVSVATSGEADGASVDPDLGGVDGELVAFSSQATNLVGSFVDGNGPAPDVYLHHVPSTTTLLVSRSAVFGPTSGGDAGSSNPDLSREGTIVAFESDAADLLPAGADANGLRDVYYAVFESGVFQGMRRASLTNGGLEGTGGDSRNASVFVFDEGLPLLGEPRVRVAFESDKTDLVAELPPMAATNVYLFDSLAPGSTTLLNQVINPQESFLGEASDAMGAAAPADSRNPVISPLGNAVMFETLADNLDFTRPRDENFSADVVFVDLKQFDTLGFILPYRVSVTADGGEANGSSSAARFASFPSASGQFPVGLAAFATESTNLGTADNDPSPAHMVLFLDEIPSTLAKFDTDPSPPKEAPNVPIQFTDTSNGMPDTWLWDFGDGDTSTEQNPVHTYTAVGTYTVTLTAQGALGDDTVVKTDLVQVLDESDAMFTASPSIAAIAVGSNVTVNFDSSQSTECPDTWEWSRQRVDSMGTPIPDPLDGIFSNAPNPSEDFALGASDLEAFYEVSLTTSGKGGTGTPALDTVQVFEQVTAAIAVDPGTPPSGPVDPGTGELTVQFMDVSTGAVDPATYAWDFDGGMGDPTAANPLVTFEAGDYDVTLTVTGKGGDMSTSPATDVLAIGTITAALTAGDAIDPGGGVSINFANTSDIADPVLGPMDLSYRWLEVRGGGSETLFSTAFEPSAGEATFQLSDPTVKDTFTVKLVAGLDAPSAAGCDCGLPLGCDCSGNVTFTVFPELDPAFSASASFTPSGTPGKPPHTVSFTDLTTGAGASPTYRWFYDPPGPGGEIEFTPVSITHMGMQLPLTFEFPSPGDYSVRLQVTAEGPSGPMDQVESFTDATVPVDGSPFSDVYTIIDASCNGCHTSTPVATSCGESTGNGGLPMGSQSQAHSNLVGVLANCQQVCGLTNMFRVSAGSPSMSFIMDKIDPFSGSDPGCGNKMGTLTADQISIFRSWIQDGATGP